jgi:hypothetical protein
VIASGRFSFRFVADEAGIKTLRIFFSYYSL